MGCCQKIYALLVLGSAVGIGYLWMVLNTVPPLPEMKATYWGPGAPKPDSLEIKPWKINIPDSVIKDLQGRLNNSREFVAPLEGQGFQYGINTDYLNSMINYWRTQYDWKAREKFLNQFNHFKTEIQGLNIHFLHVKPTKVTPGTEVVPLLLLHGWPGSIREFYTLIPYLTTPREGEKFIFEVIAPSLPGYGFSDGAARPGLATPQMGFIFNTLMNRLGFKEYYIQGGDWGSAIGAAMSVLFPNNVKAYHSNMCFSMHPVSTIKRILSCFVPSFFSDNERDNEKLSLFPSQMLEETGYFHLQATKPDTVGVALTDSPAGLAAYILEKFSTWTNHAWKTKPDGGLNNLSRDDLLDNIMIYWVSRSITTSMRLYSENFSRENMSSGISRNPIKVPTACAVFPNELFHLTRKLIENSYPNLVRFSEMPKGGHFPAFEVPELLAEDIWQFISTIRSSPK